MATTVSRSGRAEFAAMVRGTHKDIASFNRYVHGQMRRAWIRADYLRREVVQIGKMLKDGLIDGEDAMALLAETEALYLVQPDEPPFERIGESPAGAKGD